MVRSAFGACLRKLSGWMLDVERWAFSLFYIRMTIFLGCGFAAKYREGVLHISIQRQATAQPRRININ